MHSLVNHVKKALLSIADSPCTKGRMAQPGAAERFGWGQGAGDALVTLREALEEGLYRQGLLLSVGVSACLP